MSAEPIKFTQVPDAVAGTPVSVSEPQEIRTFEPPEPEVSRSDTFSTRERQTPDETLASGEDHSNEELDSSAARSPESYEAGELDELYFRGELKDTLLVDRRERLIEAERDRADEEENNLQRFRLGEAQEAGYLEQARLIRDSALAGNDGLLEAGPNSEVVREVNRRALADYDAQAKVINAAAVDRSIRELVVEAAGDSGELRQTLETLDTTGLLRELYSATFRAGQSANSAGGLNSEEFSRLLGEERKRVDSSSRCRTLTSSR